MAETWPRTRRGKKQKNNPHTRYDALAARRALRDAYRAKDEFSAALVSNSVATIRLRWIAAITILRAVGHTLQKIDASRSPALNSAIESAWKRWKTQRYRNLIFHEFIEKERNIILKEYSSSLIPTPSEKQHFLNAPEVYSTILVGDQMYSPLEAINSSIKWWEEELSHIEAEARNPDS